MLEEAKPFTQIGATHIYEGLVEADTVSDSLLHLKPTPVDSESTQPGDTHQGKSQVATQVEHPKRDPDRN